MPTHVGDNADDGADENGKEMPRLGSDTGRGGDEPDDETSEHGVAKGLELGPLPLSRSGSLHGASLHATLNGFDAAHHAMLRSMVTETLHGVLGARRVSSVSFPTIV